jgi:hypothetical protein
LEANRDYTIIEAPFPAMRAMLAEKKADMISAVPPFSLDPDLNAMAHSLFTQKDALGITQLTMWTARTPFIQQNRAALVDFLEDTVRASAGTATRRITKKRSPLSRGSTRRRRRAWNGLSPAKTNIATPMACRI